MEKTRMQRRNYDDNTTVIVLRFFVRLRLVIAVAVIIIRVQWNGNHGSHRLRTRTIQSTAELQTEVGYCGKWSIGSANSRLASNLKPIATGGNGELDLPT